MTKILVLIRHAHRDTTVRSADNGLSEKGRKQAAALLRHYLKTFPAEEFPERPRILSSPKKRCTESVTGISREAGVRVELSDEFLEQASDENQVQLRRRAEKFIEKWSKAKGPAVTIVCSHGDWLPAALAAATGARAEFKKGAWAEIRTNERGQLQLEWLIQSFK